MKSSPTSACLLQIPSPWHVIEIDIEAACKFARTLVELADLCNRFSGQTFVVLPFSIR